MFAIVKTGGKQYKAEPNRVLVVERLEGAEGDTLTLQEVLLVGDESGTEVGTPLVAGVTVLAKILEQNRADKIIVFKKKRRHNYRRKQGHRQDQTVLRVLEVVRAGVTQPKAAVAKPKVAVDESPASENAAPKKRAKKAAEKPAE